MGERGFGEVMKRIREQVRKGLLRFTLHAHQRMVEENVAVDEVVEALMNGEVVENYPEHKRGACCLVCGRTKTGRYVHVVCTTGLDVVVIITVYEPRKPKWRTPFERARG